MRAEAHRWKRIDARRSVMKRGRGGVRIEETRLVEWVARSTVALRDSPSRTSSERADPAPSAERPKSYSSSRTAARRKEGGGHNMWAT